MRKKSNEKYIYYGGALLFCVLLAVSFLSILAGNPLNERKKAQPEKNLEAEKLRKVQTEEKKEKPESNANAVIRVVIKSNGFKSLLHKNVKLRAKNGLILHFGSEQKEVGANETITIDAKNKMFQGKTITVEPKQPQEKIAVASLKRGYGVPAYRGKLELFAAENKVAIVNELLLEEYLYAVVPSEMPASYELEALKAQAVCARSYAAKQTKNYSYPQYKAHVDDSTAFQVYGNSKEQEKAIQAVNETAGEKVWHENKVATTYYFSTSCGRTTSVAAWGTKPGKKNAYLKSVKVAGESGAYEKDLPWYKWKASINQKLLSRLIISNTGKNIGKLKNVKVTKRGAGDIALEITAVGDKGSVKVSTENKIRRALGGNGYLIARQDGKTVKSSELLPSAFFTIEKNGKDYIVEGGGFGHGIGMSQNAANEMAKEGKNYQEILKFFYQEIEVKK